MAAGWTCHAGSNVRRPGRKREALAASRRNGPSRRSTSSTGSTGSTGSTASTDTSSTPPTESVALQADPGGALAYVEKTLSAKPGELSIAFTNDSPIAHNVAVDDPKGNQLVESEIVTGASTTAQFTAKPGKYTYYCTLPGHEEAGMKGTLTIK